ncbi:ABC transporter ATP-binding protein [Egicoccus halophilus]|uniref:ABC-type quaternary amine transporter n=1 Tax=Egicoccus halophilus TaxID=1670830 RepID=A0A8J3A6T8_9ACTN|nr:ABC transporter ATP-binding protein [Egicoccus halophilus]GGI02454.1 spermidine/putrescine import ATP-binding protein PotA [Egicoccus halophilus]
MLRLRNVEKAFGDVRAVNDVSFDVHEGEILTLLGPSGCGKSTTLRLVMGLERATGGQIEYQGKVLDSDDGFVPPHKRSMGMVFQSYAIWPHMTVAKNIAYPLKLRKRPKKEIDAAIERVLALVGMEGMQDRPGTKLSGGQMQRVALARALVYEPKLLLLDEPFSNLDAQLREHMRAEVKSLQRRLGLTVLFVTHDQTEALSMSNSIVLMRTGRIIQVADPKTMYNEPTEQFVRDFVGHTIILAGELVGVGEQTARVRFPSGDEVSGQIRHRETLEVGNRAEVAIRPEKVQIHPCDSGASGVPAEVEVVLFIGNHYELQLKTSWGLEFLVVVGVEREWHEGERVIVELPPEWTQVWSVTDIDGTEQSSAQRQAAMEGVV